MPYLLRLYFIVFALPLCSHGVGFIEVDLTSVGSEKAEFPDWLVEVTESGGDFDSELGWHVSPDRPFGLGKLFLSLDQKKMSGNLALTFESPTQSNIAVQLYDSEERLLAVDLLAQRKVVDGAVSATTLLVPITEYPATAHIVLRRLDGPVSVLRLRLAELIEPVGRSEQHAQARTATVGDSLFTDLLGPQSASDHSKTEQAKSVESWLPYQPLVNLSHKQVAGSLNESQLRDLFRMLNLQGYDFNAVDFVRAAGEGRREVVELYLRAGMPVDAQGRNQYTALAEAATSGELRVIQLLCDYGADPDIKTVGGNSALRMASFTPHLEAVRMLVDCGADLNSVGAYGKTPAQSLNHNRSANYEKVDAVTLYLVTKGASPDIPDLFGNSLLHDIAAYGRSSLMAEVLPYSNDINQPDGNGMTPMMLAVMRNSNGMIRTLEAAGAPSWQPKVETLDEKLVYAVYRGRFSEAKNLLANGADPNAVDYKSQPIFFKAISKRRLDILKLLESHGADLRIRDHYGHDALGRVSGGYHTRREAIVDYLLEIGIDPNSATDSMLDAKKPYWTPLMKAADAGNLDRCMRLIKAGADPATRNKANRTAAIIAERSGYLHLSSQLKIAEAVYRESLQ